MKETTNYKLRKPEVTDVVDIDDLNYNADIVDKELKAREGLIKSATEKTTLADADAIPLSDSAASSATKKITFANVKKALKAYFDTLYNKYTHPLHTARASGLYKVTVDGNGHVSAVAAVTKADITNLGIPGSNTTYGAASTSTAGLMSAADKAKLDNTNVAFATCSTEAATAAKVVAITGNDKWTLKAGSIIVVRFSATNTAQNPTLNVNGTGAKSVWYNTGLITTGSLSCAGAANRPILYQYDGTQYVFLGWSMDANTTYSNASLGHGRGACDTAAATAAKVVDLTGYNLVTGGIVAVKFTYDVPASSTMNINSKGAKPIYYRGKAITAGMIRGGDMATFIYNGAQYHLMAIDRAASSDVDVTMAVASWAGSAAPYTYSVTISGHENMVDKVELLMGDSMTPAQLAAAQAANIAKAEWTSATVLKFYAYGTKPTIALPVKISVRKM